MADLNTEQALEPQTQKTSRVFWVLLWPLAILMRFYSFKGVFVDGLVFLSGSDSYYHLRRTIAVFYNFPHVPDTDKYLDFPYYMPVHWSYGFDIIMASIISILTFGKATQWQMEAIAALLPAFIGGLLSVVIYLIGKLLLNESTALLAGVLSALFPMTIQYSQVGNFDHHFFTALCQGLFWLVCLLASNKKENSFLSIVAGVILTVAFTSTTEFPFVVAIHLIAYFFIYLIATKERKETLLLVNLKVFSSATILLLPFVFTKYFEPNGVSPLLACSWFGCFSVSLFLAAIATGQKKIPITIAAISLILAAIFTLKFDFTVIKTFIDEVRLSQGDTLLASSIQENRPVIFDGFDNLLFRYSAFLFLSPVTLFLLIRKRKEETLLIAINLLIMLPLTMAHLRFGVLLTVPFALGSAFLAQECLLLANQYSRNYRLNKALIITLIVAAMANSVLKLDYSQPPIVVGNISFPPLYNSFIWLEQHSPKVDVNAPQYATLANDWSLGHWIIYYTKRPTISSPLLFGTSVFDSAKIFIQPPKTAIKPIDKRQIKYIIITPSDFEYLFNLAGNNLPASNPNILGDLFYDSLYGQLLLYNFDKTDSTRSGLNRFRLVFETPEKTLSYGEYVANCAIFEVVTGAHLVGQVKANANIKVTTEIKTSARVVPYVVEAKADNEGKFDIVVPYSTTPDESTNLIATGYTIKSDESISKVNVTTTQIRNGEQVRVDFSK
jgi:asparagine N-glycosylation enzyme membrane subunit Stt3